MIPIGIGQHWGEMMDALIDEPVVNRYEPLRDAFLKDGVVLLKGVLDQGDLLRAQDAFDWSLSNPTPIGLRYYPETGATFFADSFNINSWPLYRHVLEHGELASAVAAVLGTSNLWFWFEQVFLKEGGSSRRTPWHQDSPFLPVDGSQFAVVWISLDSVSRADSLEFIRGSHQGPMFNGTSFDPSDDTTPVFDEKVLPRLPNIEANRSAWDIVSWAVEPGDAIVFHPSTLHGGAPTHPGGRRRTLSLRFFGDDVVYATRPQALGAAHVGYDSEGKPLRDLDRYYVGLTPGAPFRHPEFFHVIGQTALAETR